MSVCPFPLEQRNLSQGDVEEKEEKVISSSISPFHQKNFCKIFFIHDLITGAQKKKIAITFFAVILTRRRLQDPTAGGILLLPAVLRFHPSVRPSFFSFDHGFSGNGLSTG